MTEDSDLISPYSLERDLAPSPSMAEDKFDMKGVGLLTFAHGLHDTYASWLAALLPVLIEKFGITNTMAGALSMANTIPSVLQPFIGYLADKRNLRWLIVIAPAITALTMSSLVVLPSYELLIIFLLISGLSAAGIHSVGPGVTSHYSGKSIGKGMSFWMIGGELGFSVGPLLATNMVLLIGISRMPLVAIGGVLVSLFLISATRNVDTRAAKGPSKIDWVAFKGGLRKAMFPMILLLITRALMGVMLSTFLPTFLRSEGASLGFAGAGMAIAGAAGVVGSYIAGTLSDKIGQKKVLAAAIIATTVFLLLFINTDGWLRVVMLLFSGFFGLSLFPVMIATIMKFFPETRSFANGIFMSLHFIIQATGALVAGRIADLYGLSTAFMVAALVLPLGLLALMLMPKDKTAEA